MGGKKSLLISLFVLILLRIVIGKLFFKMQIDILPGEYCAPLTIALAVNVFLLFKNVSLKSSRLITFFSSSAVSVYLITEYPMVRDWLTIIMDITIRCFAIMPSKGCCMLYSPLL
jgi:hypothetical protein